MKQRGWLARLAPILVVLAFLAVAEGGARWTIASSASDRISRAVGEPVEVDVRTTSGALAIVTGDIDSLQVRSAGASSGLRISATCTGVHRESGDRYLVDDMVADIGLTETEIVVRANEKLSREGGLLSALGSVRSAKLDPSTRSITVDVMGLGALTVTPAVRDGKLVAGSAYGAVLGIPVPDTITDSIVSTITTDLAAMLPPNTRVRDIKVANDQLTVSFDGNSVPFS